MVVDVCRKATLYKDIRGSSFGSEKEAIISSYKIMFSSIPLGIGSELKYQVFDYLYSQGIINLGRLEEWYFNCCIDKPPLREVDAKDQDTEKADSSGSSLIREEDIEVTEYGHKVFYGDVSAVEAIHIPTGVKSMISSYRDFGLNAREAVAALKNAILNDNRCVTCVHWDKSGSIKKVLGYCNMKCVEIFKYEDTCPLHENKYWGIGSE